MFMSFKKATSLALAVIFSVAMSLPAFAAEKSSDTITPSTVITEENITKVLNYVGLNSNSFTKTEGSECYDSHTVKDLQNAIAQYKDEANRSKKVNSITNNNTTAGRSNVLASSSSGVVSLSQTADMSTYSILFEVAAGYRNGKWTSYSGPKATIDDPDVGLIHKITKQSHKVSFRDSATTLAMDSAVEVTAYYGIKDLKVKIGSETVNSTSYWYVSDYD